MSATILETIGPAPVDRRADQVYVPMRDGVRLATDIYLPASAGLVPAVLVRLPYDKCGRYTFMPAVAPFLLDRGYAFIVQDVRGKFRSEGETMAYVHEVADGFDTIEWITQQIWSNGVVGMFGDSYYGWTQWAAVASGHPALRAIVPRVSGAELATVRVGTPPDSGIPPLYGGLYFAEHWVDQRRYEFDVDWSVRPLATVFDEAFRRIGTRSAAFDQMVSQAPGFVPYPTGHPFSHPEVPALHSVGWFDNIAPYSMDDYMTLQSRGRALQYLIADSTDHENYRLADVPIRPECDHDASDEALQRLLPHYIGPALDFYDAFLKGRPSTFPRVRWHQGHGDWHASDSWPPPQARPLRLFLAEAGHATRDIEGGRLMAEPPTVSEACRWLHRPDDLVPSTVVNPFAYLREQPDEREVQSRDDVATFTSEPFDAGLDLAGPLEARLSISSSAPTSHLYAKVCDVAGDGTAHMIVRGQTFVAHADAGRSVSIYLGHSGYRLQPGHRLRLHIAASDFPLYLPHPGDAQNSWRFTTGTSSEQELQSGGSHAAYLSMYALAASR